MRMEATMSDLIQVRIGNPPWSPAPGTEVADVIQEYDGPLLVILNQNGTEYMGRCVFGETGPQSIWVYCRIDSALEGVELRQGSPEKIDETADYLTQGELTAAIVDSDKILFAAVVDVPEGTWLERSRSLSTQLGERVARLNEGVENLSASIVSSRRR